MSSEYNIRIFISGIIRHKPQTTVLTVALVLVGMIFLVPAITEKAQGRVEAKAYSENGFATFSNAQTHLEGGKFVQLPTPSGTSVKWITAGTSIIGGNEQGWVQYDIAGGLGKITFYFINPNSGQNTCKVVAPNFL